MNNLPGLAGGADISKLREIIKIREIKQKIIFPSANLPFSASFTVESCNPAYNK